VYYTSNLTGPKAHNIIYINSSYIVQVLVTECWYKISLFLSNFSSILWRNSLSLYIYLSCISALQLYSKGYSFGYLSHHGFPWGGGMCCKLWGNYLGVISPLMRPTKLVQFIKWWWVLYLGIILLLYLHVSFFFFFGILSLVLGGSNKTFQGTSLFELLGWSASSILTFGLLPSY